MPGRVGGSGMPPAGARTQPAPYRAQPGGRPGAADRRDHLGDADPAGPLITDAATRTGWDGARVSAAAPCRTLAFASCSGRPGATAGALREGADPRPLPPARPPFPCPRLADTEPR